MPPGFKDWWNTQRKNLWLNLAKGGKAPTTWQGLMSENVDPITCPSIEANPSAGLVGCSSDGRQLCRAASEFLFSLFHGCTLWLPRNWRPAAVLVGFSRHFQANWAGHKGIKVQAKQLGWLNAWVCCFQECTFTRLLKQMCSHPDGCSDGFAGSIWRTNNRYGCGQHKWTAPKDQSEKVDSQHLFHSLVPFHYPSELLS